MELSSESNGEGGGGSIEWNRVVMGIVYMMVCGIGVYMIKRVVEVVRMNRRLERLPLQGYKWYKGGVLFEVLIRQILNGKKGKEDLMEKSLEYQAKLGEIYVGFVGWIGFVTINGGALIREVSVKSDGVHFKKNFGYDLSSPLLGSSLLLSSGSFWHSQRKKMEMGFGYKQISRVLRIVDQLCNERMARWQLQLSSKNDNNNDGDDENKGVIELDGYKEMLELTADTIGLFTFSEKFNGKLAEAFNDVLEAFFWFIWIEGLSPLLKHIPTPFVMRYKKSLSFLRLTIRHLIQRRRSLLFLSSSPPPSSSSSSSSLHRNVIAHADDDNNDGMMDEKEEEEEEEEEGEEDMIGLLLKSKEQMSERQLEDECLGLIFAGHDTTASTLTWSLVLLSQHPSIQSLLFDEISSHSLSPPYTIGMIEKMKYMDMIVKEVLRLYPPAVIGRTALKDLTLINGKTAYHIPEGAEFFINLYALHRNPVVWGEDAHLFNPQRMADYTNDVRKVESYLPFGEVPRNCIGRKFAILEIKMTLFLLLSRYHISLNPSKPPPSLYPSLTLHPDSVFLLLSPRS